RLVLSGRFVRQGGGDFLVDGYVRPRHWYRRTCAVAHKPYLSMVMCTVWVKYRTRFLPRRAHCIGAGQLNRILESRQQCPWCGKRGNFVTDRIGGQLLCGDCGIVVEDRTEEV